jgi:hypothetical protein
MIIFFKTGLNFKYGAYLVKKWLNFKYGAYLLKKW